MEFAPMLFRLTAVASVIERGLGDMVTNVVAMPLRCAEGIL